MQAEISTHRQPTEAQQAFLDGVNRAGGLGFVFRSLDSLKANLATP